MLKITILLYNYKSNHSLWFGWHRSRLKGHLPLLSLCLGGCFLILIFNRLIKILKFCLTKLDF
ncbi:hypothetical protein HPPC_02035 [Helicobacter pylori PeCan4]|nr:hypothetical protein HPPC_02035 [Helicobacter pylori PeCan4]